MSLQRSTDPPGETARIIVVVPLLLVTALGGVPALCFG